MSESFGEWLQGQMDERGWSRAVLAKKAGITTGAISHIMNETRNPGVEVCFSVAVALDIPPEIVFRRAGLLPPAVPEEANVQVMAHLFRQLGPVDQEQALNFVRSLLGQENYRVLREAQAIYETLRDTQTETALELMNKFMDELKQQKGWKQIK